MHPEDASPEPMVSSAETERMTKVQEMLGGVRITCSSQPQPHQYRCRSTCSCRDHWCAPAPCINISSIRRSAFGTRGDAVGYNPDSYPKPGVPHRKFRE